MIEWRSAIDWADLALPGLPVSESAIIRRAKREDWKRRERAGKGGGFEYHYSSLPEKAFAAYVLSQKRADNQSAAERGEDSAALWRRYDELPSSYKDEADRRLRALQAVEALIERGLGRLGAIEHVAAETETSPATIRRWFALVKGVERIDRLPVLAPKWTGRSETAECPDDAWEILKADYLRKSKPSFAGCYERLQRIAEARGWKLPAERTLLRRIERDIPRPVILLEREGKEALSRAYPAQQRDHTTYHALEAVNADGHKFDLFCKWPDGTVARPIGLFWQDVRSGKCLSYRIDRTENVDAVRLSFGDLVDQFGVPDHAFLDNGRAFSSKWITGRMDFRHRFKRKAEEPLGILTQLDIQVHWTTPYHGQAKPIERMFRDFCDRVSKHPAFEGAYTGNNPTAKPENYGSRAVPIEEFLRVLDQEIHHHNARPGRRSPVCGGVLSLDQAFEDSYRSAPVRQITDAQRRLWLLAADNVSANRVDGAIGFMGNRYWSDRMAMLMGQRLTIRFDPDQLHTGIHVYQRDGRYVGFVECVMAAGFGDTEAARRHAHARKSWTKHWKGIADAEKRMSAAQVAASLPAPDGPDPIPETKVVRPIFGNLAVKAEPIGLPEDEVDEFQAGFGKNVRAMHEKFRKEQL